MCAANPGNSHPALAPRDHLNRPAFAAGAEMVMLDAPLSISLLWKCRVVLESPRCRSNVWGWPTLGGCSRIMVDHGDGMWKGLRDCSLKPAGINLTCAPLSKVST